MAGKGFFTRIREKLKGQSRFEELIAMPIEEPLKQFLQISDEEAEALGEKEMNARAQKVIANIDHLLERYENESHQHLDEFTDPQKTLLLYRYLDAITNIQRLSVAPINFQPASRTFDARLYANYATVARGMGLEDRPAHLLISSIAEDYGALSYPNFGVVCIVVPKDFPTKPDWYQQDIIAHELGHHQLCFSKNLGHQILCESPGFGSLRAQELFSDIRALEARGGSYVATMDSFRRDEISWVTQQIWQSADAATPEQVQQRIKEELTERWQEADRKDPHFSLPTRVQFLQDAMIRIQHQRAQATESSVPAPVAPVPEQQQQQQR